ncbi:MAG: hypothetical protein K6F05_06170 [Succinivibrio sp.]|nr:hypothetical protein [Succinivibrio sp.]
MSHSLFNFALTAALCCALGLVLCLIMLRPKKECFRRYPSLSSLLPYARCLGDQVIALKEGALMSVFRLRPQDLSCLSQLELEALRDRLSKVILQLDEGYLMHFEVLTGEDPHYYPQDESRLKCCSFYAEVLKEASKASPALERSYYLSVTKKLTRKKALFASLLYALPPSKALLLELKRFSESLKPIEDALSLVYEVSPLKLETNERGYAHQALDYLYTVIYGKEQHLILSEAQRSLDTLLSCADLEISTCPKLGSDYLGFIAVDGMPSELEAEALKALCALPFPCRYSTRFVSFDRKTSQQALRRIRGIWAQKTHGFLAQVLNVEDARVDRNALDQVDATEEALRAVNSQTLLFGAYTAGVIVRAEDFETLKERVSQVCKTLSALGFVARVETLNTLEAFLGSLPGDFAHNLRRTMVSNLMLSCLLPKGAVYEGERYSPNPFYGPHASPLLQGRTESGEKFFLNLHQQDLANSLIVGPPGAGKSVLLGALIFNLLRYQGMQIFAFDKGCSFYALCRALGGSHLRFDARTSLSPLRELDTPKAQERALNFLELCLRLNHLMLEPQLVARLQQALATLSHNPPEERTLDDFLICLTDSTVEAALKPYLIGGAEALLNGRSNPDLSAPLTVFECADLFERPESFRLPVLNHIFNLIESTFVQGLPRAIILDEAWAMLGDTVFAQKLLTWFKTLRKENVLVILATQSVSDFKQSGLFFDLLDCAKTRFFLPNADVLSKLESAVYTEMGLTDAQMHKIARGRPKHDYFLLKNEHFSNFCLQLPPPLLKLLSFSTESGVNRTDQLIKKYGEDFYEKLS